MMNAGCWMMEDGRWMVDDGYWMLDDGPGARMFRSHEEERAGELHRCLLDLVQWLLGHSHCHSKRRLFGVDGDAEPWSWTGAVKTVRGTPAAFPEEPPIPHTMWEALVDERECFDGIRRGLLECLEPLHFWQ